MTTQGEERVVLRNVSWRTYECLLKDYENRSAPRLAFYKGVLEIMSPLIPHERTNRALDSLVEAVLEEWGREYDNLGSTTFRRQDQEQGFEPDTCFYIAHAAAVRGKDALDLPGGDPAPDLVIEIDHTHSSIPRLPLMAAFGVGPVVPSRSGRYARGSSCPPREATRWHRSRPQPSISGLPCCRSKTGLCGFAPSGSGRRRTRQRPDRGTIAGYASGRRDH